MPGMRSHIERALIATGFALEQIGEFDRASALYKVLMVGRFCLSGPPGQRLFALRAHPRTGGNPP